MSQTSTSRDPLAWIEDHWVEDDLGDSAGFLAMGSIFRLYQTMCSEIERVLKQFGLTRTAYLTLATIQLSAERSRLLSKIASHMLVHPTTVTLVIDKLKEQGLVERRAHPSDRRATYAEITPAGSALMKEATRALDAAGYGLGQSRAELSKLVDVLAPIRATAGDLSAATGTASEVP